MPVTGQCKVDPVTGVSGDIYTAWTTDPDNGLDASALVSGSSTRALLGAQVEAVAAAVVANSGGGGGGVASVTATAPITSTGGANPVIGFALTVSAKAAGFAAAAGYHYRCTGATYSATLPAGASNVGKVVSVKNISATTVTVTCSGGDLIDGASATLDLVAGECALLVGHSSGWDLV